jgi:hypothetical protein
MAAALIAETAMVAEATAEGDLARADQAVAEAESAEAAAAERLRAAEHETDGARSDDLAS